MSAQILLALAGYAFVSSITPGPNNMMLMASGANYGFRRTIPHLLGVSLGFALMIALVGVGIMQAFEAWPALADVLRIVSILYLLYLAWRIANAPPPSAKTASGARPMSFVEAALFQWVNPKAWTMALTAIALYAPDRSLGAIATVALVFTALNLPSVSSWVWLGREMKRVLTNPVRARAFNIGMAALLVASLVPVVLE